MASSLNNSAWVEWITGLMGEGSRQSYAATLPPARFCCLLDDLPLHLVPRWAWQALQIANQKPQNLFLNPDCVLLPADQFPDTLCEHHGLFSDARSGTIAWVRDRVSGNPNPFWLGPEFENIVRGLRPHEPTPSNLDPHIRALLLGAGILCEEGEQMLLFQVRETALRRSASLFREKGYAPISNLIHPFHIAALRRYYRYQIRTGAIRLGDRQSARRYAAYKEPVARFFHRQIASAFSALAGEALRPSYVYMASYLSGAELKKHTDREQCEFSVTLCLDFAPEPGLSTSWPIRLDTSQGTVAVYQALGDGLAYRGTRLPHYRDQLAEGYTSTSIFFHYVGENYAGSLD